MPDPFLAWPGGKRRLAKHILPMLPAHTCYVEPFAGAGAIYFLKEPSKVEVLNDVNGDLVNLYRVLQHHLEEFVRQFKWALTSRQMFEWLKRTQADTLTDIHRAARFYYLQRLAFGAKVDGPTFGTSTTTKPRLNLLRIEEHLSQAHLRLTGTTVENLDWAECVRRYDREDTLFYVDPPYLGTAGYGVPFGEAEHDELADVMRGLKGRAVVSINDTPDIRRRYAGLPWKRVTTTYTAGGAGRAKRAAELVIRTWR